MTWMNFLEELIAEIEAGSLNCPAGTTIEELRQDLVELARMQDALFKDFVNSLESSDEGWILNAMSGWLTFVDPRYRALSFLRAARMLKEPETFWRALHRNWEGFGVIPAVRFKAVLRRFRPYWRKEYMGETDARGFDDLPDLITVFSGRSKNRRVGLAWTEDFATAEYDALQFGTSVIFEARVPKVDVASIWFNWGRSHLLLFDGPPAQVLRELSARDDA